MSSRPRTLLVVALWAATIVGWFAYQRASGSSTTEVAQRFVDAASGSWWAIAAYAVLAVVRPVVLFPATVLTVVAGVLFGAVLGVVVAALAANASALIAYHLGRRLRRPPGGARSASDGEMSRIEAWTQRLRANGFESVLLMRLLFLPYDPVSYVCGLVRVPVQQFLAANAIGTLPGTVAFVLVGASIERLDEGFGGIDGATLTVSVVLVAASIVASRVVRRRQSAVPG
ncbi:MAG: TVP38/TMEM64 family protein [Acidimicrobiales bacterium]|nr:TVP38/TMEM64 family protein [Acidimicrobiales bacterium]